MVDGGWLVFVVSSFVVVEWPRGCFVVASQQSIVILTMSSQDEDVKPNRFNKYGILFQNKQNLTKDQIKKMFCVFEDDDLLVLCAKTGHNAFVNFNVKENAIKARTMYPELNAIFAYDKKGPDQKLIESWKENPESDRKGGHNSRYDSDNKSCSSVASTSTQPRSSKTSMDVNVKDSGGMPLLVFTYDVEVMEGLREVETQVAVLSNLPPWLHTGEVYKLIHESTNLWPLEVEILHREERVVMHSAFVHFGTLKEAEDCVRGMNYKWVEYRQLICVLLDEILSSMNSNP
ncbi:hypothetical protein LSTR_LSTR003309 [Laodelphax striatellus]|uniref:RRM domain-containing protein n=1 Tax=Laodelphax striatellus TaxID=195883 RepID=A0A482X4K2_LAOST|nr:hypothetical protein LSTR_LSTR003309 [Laodelphax striatellus]